MLLDERLPRRLAGEALGTGLLVAVVVGSGIAATRLTDDAALQLLVNALVTALGLGAIIAMLLPVSGAHFNPAVSLLDWWMGRRRGHGLSLPHVGAYSLAQVIGAIVGAVLANALFSVPQGASTTVRDGGAILLSEVVATAGLLVLIFLLALTDRVRLVPVAVGAWIGAAYWWTSSTSFANPAVTIGRAFTDTFAGIAPASVTAFVVAQLVGVVVAAALVLVLVGERRPAPVDTLESA